MKQSRIKIPTLCYLFFCLIIFGALSQCTEDEQIVKQEMIGTDTIKTKALSLSSCSSCKYTIPGNAYIVDGKLLGIKPGDVICFNAAIKYVNSITLKNMVGTATAPIIITNCGGTANLSVYGRPYNMKISNSKYFRFTGGDTPGTYGIRMSGSTSNGVSICELSTNFEFDHVEVYNTGFAGIMAKTDPTCDDATVRGNFTMRDVKIHDNYVHHTKGEGLYIGHSFYGGYSTSCGTRYPHTIENLKVYNNVVKYSGWDAIQVGCATKGTEIYNNTIENYATANSKSQNYGMVIGAGTGGSCHGNSISNGSGDGMAVFGLADNLIHDNLIVNPGRIGIFVDERTDPIVGYKIINNTIVNPQAEGIRLYADRCPMNYVLNNIVVNPGSYSTYGEASFIMKLSKTTPAVIANNYTTRTIGNVKFVDPAGRNYRLATGSPAINKGQSISAYNIPSDFYKTSRLKGASYDIGASEY
jgi:hypothetical protein